MIKRVLGVLAALTMTAGGVAACGSDDTGGTVGTDAGKDTGKPSETGTDTGKPPGEVSVIDGDKDVPAPPADKTTGKVCTSDADCDITGAGLGRCTNKLFIISPLNPTAICMQIDASGGDACDPGDGTKIPLCDGDTGFCSKPSTSTNPATCEGLCVMDDTGKFTVTCAGKNACNTEALGSDGTTGKNQLFGTCQGGCATDADCPSPAVCDTLENICVDKVCTVDTDCTKLFSKGAPPGFKCVADAAGGKSHCKFSFAKKDGDKCTPAATAGKGSLDCLCFGKTGGATDTGMCISLCKTVAAGTANAECATGFNCDPLLNEKDSTSGKDIYAAGMKLPAGMAGYCVKSCSADADCGITGWTCTQSAGITGKSCYPPK